MQDYVIFRARKYNVRLLLSVTTFWQDADGILAFAKWAGLTYPKIENTTYYTEQWAAKVHLMKRFYRNRQMRHHVAVIDSHMV